MFLIGRAFRNFIPFEGRLYCKVKFTQSLNEAQSVIYIQATIVSDFVVSCAFDETSLKSRVLYAF